MSVPCNSASHLFHVITGGGIVITGGEGGTITESGIYCQLGH